MDMKRVFCLSKFIVCSLQLRGLQYTKPWMKDSKCGSLCVFIWNKEIYAELWRTPLEAKCLVESEARTERECNCKRKTSKDLSPTEVSCPHFVLWLQEAAAAFHCSAPDRIRFFIVLNTLPLFARLFTLQNWKRFFLRLWMWKKFEEKLNKALSDWNERDLSSLCLCIFLSVLSASETRNSLECNLNKIPSFFLIDFVF